MWPINLVRDFRLRFGRLRQTLWRGRASVVPFLPEAKYVAGHNDLFPGLRQKGGKSVYWLHQLLAELFDLIGGPEIAQFLMHLTTNTTPLTADEIAVMSSILGPAGLRYREIRVAEGGLFDLIFKYNGNLAFATWHTINLPRSGRHTRANLAVVVHELTHVYQYEQVGSRYLGEAIYMLITTRRECYTYGSLAELQAAVAAGKRYSHYNREQQAQIVQDYYSLKQGKRDVSAYEPLIAQLRVGEV
jgi:hypothetical protein